MKVECMISYGKIEPDNNSNPNYINYDGIDGVVVTCNRCGRQEESYGQSQRSINRCLWLLNRNCSENNYYVIED